MALTPEEIEARRFRLAPNGYECEAVDRFLVEIIETLRSQPVAGADGDGASPAGRPGDQDDFGRAGQEIAALLRAARNSAGAMRAEAEGFVASMRSRAELEVADIHKAAIADRDEAQQLLADARREADEIIADGVRRVANDLEAAVEQARLRAQKITDRAERQAEQIRRGERAAHQRLIAARSDLQQAIDRLAGTDVSPVLDLTIAPPHVRTGSIHDDSGSDDGVPTGDDVVAANESDPAADPSGDPLLRMVRAAVGRAVEHSATPPDDEAARAV